MLLFYHNKLRFPLVLLDFFPCNQWKSLLLNYPNSCFKLCLLLDTLLMRMDIGEEGETLLNPRSFKVHGKMCTEFLKLVDRISRILPNIEAARPRSTSGIEILCSLSKAIEKAKLLLQHCSECSKLYLVNAPFI
ncbi:hypothetical protein RJT34_05900 [Clitoria ternatea]|uniref:Uncharacterized protein n=1 Tax=Clitoria ternatea TaxID=43366 RepID=A0AAN9K373_CLITE